MLMHAQSSYFTGAYHIARAQNENNKLTTNQQNVQTTWPQKTSETLREGKKRGMQNLLTKPPPTKSTNRQYWRGAIFCFFFWIYFLRSGSDARM